MSSLMVFQESDKSNLTPLINSIGEWGNRNVKLLKAGLGAGVIAGIAIAAFETAPFWVPALVASGLVGWGILGGIGLALIIALVVLGIREISAGSVGDIQDLEGYYTRRKAMKYLKDIPGEETRVFARATSFEKEDVKSLASAILKRAGNSANKTNSDQTLHGKTDPQPGVDPEPGSPEFQQYVNAILGKLEKIFPNATDGEKKYLRDLIVQLSNANDAELLVFVGGYIYLKKIMITNSDVLGKHNPVLITTVLVNLSAKNHLDKPWLNKSFADAFRISVRQFNAIERECLGVLNYNLSINLDEYNATKSELVPT